MIHTGPWINSGFWAKKKKKKNTDTAKVTCKAPLSLSMCVPWGNGQTYIQAGIWLVFLSQKVFPRCLKKKKKKSIQRRRTTSQLAEVTVTLWPPHQHWLSAWSALSRSTFGPNFLSDRTAYSLPRSTNCSAEDSINTALHLIPSRLQAGDFYARGDYISAPPLTQSSSFYNS